MVRILVLNEDPIELRVFANSLRKIGFDVETHNGEIGFTEKLLGFKADVILVALYGKKVTSLNINKVIQASAVKTVKTIFHLHNGYTVPQEQISNAKISAFISEGQNFETVISIIADVLEADPTPWLEKFKRVLLESPDPDSLKIFGGASAQWPIKVPDDAANKSRIDKYGQFLHGIEVSATSKINKNDAKRIQKELKKDWDLKSLEDLDAAKRDFVKALFKKKD